MRLKDMCADEMPREKLLSKGAEALSNTELLAILLRTGRGGANVIDVAREILVRSGGNLSDLAIMNADELCNIEGIGPGKAVSIAAAFELGRRVNAEDVAKSRPPVSSPRGVFRLMYPLMKHLDHEECWILLLNKAGKLISRVMISVGGLDSTIIDNRVIIKKTVDKKATGVILVHNHPSGSALPSSADIEQTRLLNTALKTCGLALIDHVIIAPGSYYSFADEVVVEP